MSDSQENIKIEAKKWENVISMKNHSSWLYDLWNEEI